MELALVLMAVEPTTRILAVLGFLALLPLVIIGISRLGRRVVEKNHARELTREVEFGDDEDWLQRTTSDGR